MPAHKITVKRDCPGHYTWVCGPFTGYAHNEGGPDGKMWNGDCDQRWEATNSPVDRAVEEFGSMEACFTFKEYKQAVEDIVATYVKESFE